MIWRGQNFEVKCGTSARIMGVLNVTFDSFFDGGNFLDATFAVQHGRAMAEAGAEIIDIGGESTRPGAEPVPEDVEMERVLPVIAALAREFAGWETTQPGRRAPLISVDTSKPAVAEAAVKAGAQIINDVTGLRSAEMRKVVNRTGAGAVLMHMQGTPRDMQRAPHYEDVVAEVQAFFQESYARCLHEGIAPEQLVFDPGIGFGKRLEHNLSLLRHLPALRVAGRPLLVGCSRKSFLGKLVESDAMADRFWPTVAFTSYARERGASILRVHDVAANAQALRMTEAILDATLDAQPAAA